MASLNCYIETRLVGIRRGRVLMRLAALLSRLIPRLGFWLAVKAAPMMRVEYRSAPYPEALRHAVWKVSGRAKVTHEDHAEVSDGALER